MRLFTDSRGTQWRIDITLGTLEDIQSEMGINLIDEPDSIPEDPRKIAGLLWITCMDQAKELGISPQDFGKRLGGKVIKDAYDSWMKEYSDFFGHLSPARGRAIAALWDQAQEVEEVRAQLVGRVLSSTFTDLRELLAKLQGS